MRPSRFFARTPQPAGHSRQTVANHAATPGTICSFGTTSGRIDSVACWQPAVAAAAPDAVTILKKSRRFIYRVLEVRSDRGWRVTGTRGSVSRIRPRVASDRHAWPRFTDPTEGGEWQARGAPFDGSDRGWRVTGTRGSVSWIRPRVASD